MADIKEEPINLEKVDTLIGQGRLFRAKEIVNGMIGSYVFHPNLFEKLGDIFEALKEPELADKHYFYSGIRNDKTAVLVSKYRDFLLDLGHKSTANAIVSDIPKALKRADRESFPASVRSDLLSLGVKGDTLEWALSHYRARENPVRFRPERAFGDKLKSAVAVAAGFAAFFIFVMLAIAAAKGVLSLFSAAAG